MENDISLGVENEMGILLYGTNAVGKTSLIRAIGVAVIIAQCGMYVPCSSFLFKPYNAIFSRILGNDNLFKQFCDCLNIKLLLINKDFNKNDKRLKNAEKLKAIIEKALKKNTTV